MNELKTDEAILIELNQRIGEAEKGRGDRFMADILSDVLRFRRASGIIHDKTQYLNDLINPANTYDRLKVSNVEVVHSAENIVVVSLVVDAAGMREGKPFSGKFRNIRIFMKEADAPHGWRCHMWFNTKMSD